MANFMDYTTIRTVNMILGYKCNSKCNHCDVQASPQSTEELDLMVAEKYAKQVCRLNTVKRVIFNGGEPFLYLDHLKRIIPIFKNWDENIKIIISTGAGEFDTSERTKKLLDDVNLVKEFWVSIDKYHLRKNPIQNYLNLEENIKKDIDIIYSICYSDIKDFSQILELMQKNGIDLAKRKIAKQPVLKLGNARHLTRIPELFSDSIPTDFKCLEKYYLAIWPDGTLTNCSSFCSRVGLIKRYNSFEQFVEGNQKDDYLKLRHQKSLKEISMIYKSKPKFNIVSQCSACHSILKQMPSQSSDRAHPNE